MGKSGYKWVKVDKSGIYYIGEDRGYRSVVKKREWWEIVVNVLFFF